MIVSRLMSSNVITCSPQESLHDAAGKMWDRDIGCLPVVDADGHVVGMITDRDVCMAAYTQGKPLSEVSVDAAMAHEVFSCLPSDRIEHAEGIMKLHQVRRLPVIDSDGRLVGLIAANDLARETARELKKKAPEARADVFVSTIAAICEPRRPAVNVAAQ